MAGYPATAVVTGGVLRIALWRNGTFHRTVTASSRGADHALPQIITRTTRIRYGVHARNVDIGASRSSPIAIGPGSTTSVRAGFQMRVAARSAPADTSALMMSVR